MKFLHKINRQYFRAFTLVLILISIVSYLVLRFIMANQIKESIIEKEYAIKKEIAEKNNLPNIYPLVETKIIDKSEAIYKDYKEILLTDEAENEIEPYLEYNDVVQLNNRYYLITLRHSLISNNELILAIGLPLLLILIVTFIALFIMLKKMNKSLWMNFEYNLAVIEKFSLQNLHSLLLKQTGIEEFDRLNKTVIGFTEKIRKDYSVQKEFAENASHESKTPLAVMQSKLELLIQTPNLSKEQVDIIDSLGASVRRLANLNSGLLLIAKIDNNQFVDIGQINISKVILDSIQIYEPIITTQRITLKQEIGKDIIVNCNKDLADILINNVLSNAIHHNIKGGDIEIKLTNKTLAIKNTGEILNIEPEKLFERFQKATNKSNSVGLGLSIARKICQAFNWRISYAHTAGNHKVIITFN